VRSLIPPISLSSHLTQYKEKACVDCHARKVRCDGAVNGFPCSNCRSVNIECGIVARRKRGRARSRIAQQPRQIASNSEEAVRSRNDSRSIEAAPLPARQDGGGGEGEPQPVAAGEEELAKEHLVNFFGQNLQETPIRTRLAYVGSELANLNYLVRQRSANHNVYHYPCSNTYIPRVQKISQVPAAPSLIPKDAFIIPPKHISDVLIAAYFEDIHPTFPIVDKGRFLTLYHDPQSAPSLLLLQAICLAGSHVTAAFKNNQDFKVSFFRRAKALFDGRYEEDRMEMVQAALLLTWFSDGGDDICANAWWWIGVASRTAIGLGMHREVEPSKMSDVDKRTWKRMWWCLVQFDCLVSLCHGRPQNM
jgi:transcriptional regulatory protein AMDR